MRSPSPCPRLESGFNLLELMIAVAIIGILATIAIPQFHAYQLRTKSAEAKTNLGAIATAQRARFSESGRYLAIPPEPPAIPGSVAVPFNSSGTAFSQLGFAPAGNVYFSYGIATSADGTGFTADAGADIDANGVVQFWGLARPDGAGAAVPGAVGCNAAVLVPGVIGGCDPTAGRTVF